MEVGLFVLGILVGVGLAWYLLDRYQHDESEAREANHNARLAALQDELREFDFALAETKERLIALADGVRTADARAKSLEAERRRPSAQPSRRSSRRCGSADRRRASKRAGRVRRAPSARTPQPDRCRPRRRGRQGR